jgi:DNA end-binding protein Ku
MARLALALWLLALATLAPAPMARAAESGLITLPSGNSLRETARRFREAVEAKGWKLARDSRSCPMPRPTWSGHLKLSLVACPIFLVPATSEAERIRLNQINAATGNRIAMKTVDAVTGEPVERAGIVKGYQYEKGQYVLLDNAEIEQIQIESTKVLDLARFVPREQVDMLYVESPYYIHPEGKTGIEAFRVIREALLNQNKVGLGRIVLSSREHPVMLEPRGEGLVMWTLRTPQEVRQGEYDLPADALNKEMVQLAESILDRFTGDWEPDQFHDRYQDALRALVDAKIKGLPANVPQPVAAPSNVVDLMAALKQSLAGGRAKAAAAANDSAPVAKETGSGFKKARGNDRRQTNMLLPVKGDAAKPAAVAKAAPKAASKPAAKRRAAS